uniref:Bm12926 n=1 Tax=Brugia malayi TaxID=6279 RepID=A0A1I9G608_BRUMA|nr:Bm12926 [Brugia malayi]
MSASRGAHSEMSPYFSHAHVIAVMLLYVYRERLLQLDTQRLGRSARCQSECTSGVIDLCGPTKCAKNLRVYFSELCRLGLAQVKYK